MNTQLSGPKHARADVGRAHRGRSLLAAAAASLVALTGLSGIALASDEDETTNPSTSTSSLQTNATEGAPPDETQPTGDAGTISSGTAGGTSAALEESATADPKPEVTISTKAPKAIQSHDLQAAPLVAGSNLSCDAKSVYSVLSDGTLRHVSIGATTTVTSLSKWSGQSNYDKNGLAISAGGTAAYIVARNEWDRTNSKVAVAKYDPIAKTWNQVVDWNSLNVGVAIVAGAVDISSSSGAYYFGGYEARSGGSTILFHLWKMDTTTFSITKVGTVDTGLPSNRYSSSTSPNGDMAFDAAGNLYIVRSGISRKSTSFQWTNTTNIISVTSSALSSANGGGIRSSSSASKASALASVNGIAFAADGSVYMGNGTTLSEFNPSTWVETKADITRELETSTDLATCASPLTLTLKKNVVQRVDPSDQFSLTIYDSAGGIVSNVLTNGEKVGVQPVQAGPFPVLAGSQMAIGEEMAPGSKSSGSLYATGAVCTNTSNSTSVAVDSSGKLIMPSTPGAAVECVITNSPLVANVTINKQMQDINGANPQPQQGWTVGAAMTQTSGTVTSTNPTATTLPTGSDGSASWTITFGSSSSAAMVAVHEEQRTGYDFVSGSCTVTSLSGIETTTSFSVPTTQNLTGIVPGDQVNCTYTNKPSSATLTLVKNVINSHNGSALPTSWSLSATMDGGSAPTISGSTGSAKITGAVVPVGVYNLSESTGPTGYEASAWSCVNATTSGSKVTLVANSNVTCTITNSDLPGSVTWSKTDTSSPANLLAGSVWTLTGPKTSDNQPGPSVDVEDCVAGSNSACTGQDKNPVAGEFLVTSLSWGSYTLIEKAAPAGYLLDPTPQNFTIKGDALTYSFVTAFKNKQVTPPSLPLTGGLGTDTFLLAGGGLLALAGIGGWIHRRRSLRVQRA